jgi:proline iminopeptidase
LRLERDSFVLCGQSWGGILAIEYALAHPQNLKGIVISNMMSDIRDYNAYAQDVLKPAMDQTALSEIESLEAAGEIENPRYMELLYEQHYAHHILRMPVEDWPNPVQRAFAAINPGGLRHMQGPSELGISQEAKLAQWSRFDDLPPSGCPPWSSERATTPWTPRICRGWRTPPARAVSLLPGGQPPRHVRRPAKVLLGLG